MSLDKIKRLIALAGSPFPEEARTAAYLACRFLVGFGDAGFRALED